MKIENILGKILAGTANLLNMHSKTHEGLGMVVFENGKVTGGDRMSEIEKLRMLEGAIVDLVSAIQKGNTTLSDEIDAVDEAVHKFPEWRVEIHPLERSVSK